MKYFTFNELTASNTAQRLNIDNTPNEAAINNLYQLVQQVLDPAREQLGLPISVNSGYRSAALNKEVGGVINSLHLHIKKGEKCLLGVFLNSFERIIDRSQPNPN